MKFNYKNSNVNYEYYDNNSKISLVFLHGWGQNIQMMIPLAKPFIKKYNCMIIDLPGFGDSEEPQEVYTIYDYAEMVNKLLTSKKIKNPIIIGHSFGGKIALVYATKYKTNKIVLLASPYKKKIEKDNFKLKILRFCKKVPLLNRLEGIAKKYNEIVETYSYLLNLITEVQFFISQCKKVIKLIAGNTSLEQSQKAKIKTAIDLIEIQAEPLYNEKERLKTIEMFYRNIYTRREF